MGEPVVRCEISGSGSAQVATITLDSPGNRNALSRQLIADLHTALDTAEAAKARAIVLGHTDPAFCAGADLKERGDGPTDSTPMIEAMKRLMGGDIPTIAAVRGPVRAGGIGLMASCDLVVVASTVTFAFTEVRIGVAPAIISVPILRRCSWSPLAAAFLTGEAFDAPYARHIGLVTHVDDDVDGRTAALVSGILAGGPTAVAATKGLLHAGADWTAMQQLSEQLFSSAEAAEGIRAFTEKRPPVWQTAGESS